MVWEQLKEWPSTRGGRWWWPSGTNIVSTCLVVTERSSSHLAHTCSSGQGQFKNFHAVAMHGWWWNLFLDLRAWLMTTSFFIQTKLLSQRHTKTMFVTDIENNSDKTTFTMLVVINSVQGMHSLYGCNCTRWSRVLLQVSEIVTSGSYVLSP